MLGQRAVRAQERLLERVLRLLNGPEHVTAEAEEHPVMAVVEDLERPLFPRSGELGEPGVGEEARST